MHNDCQPLSNLLVLYNLSHISLEKAICNIQKASLLDYALSVMIVKIDKKYSIFLLATLMTLAMDFTMTLTMTIIMTGINPGLPMRFGGGFLIGFVVGLPTSLLVIPAVRKIVDRMTAN
jgi:hypothetical protein